ncbi:MAG TPA: GNAT family N-acetyltransferase [Vicinamibacterales bacterium]|nr:GNAT family N-acetyltransferase [Vicinamibacterales bacterium]
MTIETARLVLRPVTPEDHAALHALFTQPGVRRFVFDDRIVPPEQVTDIIGTSTELFRTQRFGLWLARPKTEAAAATPPTGFGAFWYFREPPELELLYGVADAAVRQGYGREIARAIVDYGFATLAMADVRASTDACHRASRRLLEELGFAFERQAVAGGLDSAFYVLRNVPAARLT